MGNMLSSYGRHMYECGKALFNFRHLVVFALREFPGLRGHLSLAWDAIARWEELEPVEHRRPVPLKMLEAMVSLAIAWKWTRIGCVLLIAYFGCCRPGEVIKACRGQLVFPRDLGEASGPVFCRIQKPKPGRRGMGRVQHTKIKPTGVCSFLWSILGALSSEAFIYPGSFGMFRTR